jgi:uncharacterized protein (DUF2267 family)
MGMERTTKRRLTSDGVLQLVQEAAGTDRSGAELVAHAVLTTLGERIAEGEAQDLAAQLPPELAPWVATKGGAEGFDVDEFLRRVAERTRADLPGAERYARAVFLALAHTVSPDELADVEAELSKDYAPLLPRGRWVDRLPLDEFLERVAARAGVDVQRARRATEAVLEATAERVAGGDVDDLIPHLPVELHAPLKRGRDWTGANARRMPVGDFLRRVSDLEGEDIATAREHARAVFVTLREAVGVEEFFDIEAQLPDDYAPLLGLR